MRNRLTIPILLTILALFTFTTVAQCKVIYVSKNGDDFKTGFTWALANRTIQAGINTAVSGDEVWVATGTYVECITLKSGVGVYGGFMGSETARSERNWITNITVINANQMGSAVTSPSGTSNAAIDGFTIQNGTPGISCSSSPTISNNTITRNTASGIYCSSSSAPIISNNIIIENTSVRGGGIRCSSSSPTITNNTITMNAAYEGGGIYCESSSSPNISNNTITGNSAVNGGAIHCLSSSPNISNNGAMGKFVDEPYYS